MSTGCGLEIGWQINWQNEHDWQNEGDWQIVHTSSRMTCRMVQNEHAWQNEHPWQNDYDWQNANAVERALAVTYCTRTRITARRPSTGEEEENCLGVEKIKCVGENRFECEKRCGVCKRIT
eukprot:jgi/Botrbrau1/1617/Bobra.0185s0032.1